MGFSDFLPKPKKAAASQRSGSVLSPSAEEAFDFLSENGWNIAISSPMAIFVGKPNWRTSFAQWSALPEFNLKQIEWTPPYSGFDLDGVHHAPTTSLKPETYTVASVKGALKRYISVLQKTRKQIDALYEGTGKRPPKAYTISYNHGEFDPTNLPSGKRYAFSWVGGGGHDVHADNMEDAALLAQAKGIIFSAFDGVKDTSRGRSRPLVPNLASLHPSSVDYWAPYYD